MRDQSARAHFGIEVQGPRILSAPSHSAAPLHNPPPSL